MGEEQDTLGNLQPKWPEGGCGMGSAREDR